MKILFPKQKKKGAVFLIVLSFSFVLVGLCTLITTFVSLGRSRERKASENYEKKVYVRQVAEDFRASFIAHTGDSFTIAREGYSVSVSGNELTLYEGSRAIAVVTVGEESAGYPMTIKEN